MIAITKLIRINQTLFENLSADFECQISIAITIAIKNRSPPIHVEEKKNDLAGKTAGRIWSHTASYTLTPTGSTSGRVSVMKYV